MVNIIAQPEYSFEVHESDPSRSGDLNPKVVHETWAENVYRIFEEDFWGEKPSFVDIGANIGVVSIWVDRFNEKRKDKIKIIAVEPEPANFDLLARNVARNPSFSKPVLINKAVHYENTTVKISPEGANSNILGSNGHDIDTITIEQIIKSNKIEEISVMKVDIEGFEIDLFMNTPISVINKIKYIILEVEETTAEKFGALVSRFTNTHKVEILGHYDMGAYLWCRRY